MSAMRVWNFAAALLMIAVIALGWFLGISPKLAEAARFDSERLAVQGQNDITRVQIAQFEQDAARLDELRSALADLRAAFPTQAEYDAAVESLLGAVSAQGLSLEGVGLSEPVTTIPNVLAPEEVLPEPPVTDAGTVPAGTLLVVRTTLTVVGSLDAVLNLVDALQKAERFTIVPLWSYSAEAESGLGSATLNLSIYVVAGEDLAPGTAPTPEPSPTPTPEPTDPSASPTPDPTDTTGPTPSATPSP